MTRRAFDFAIDRPRQPANQSLRGHRTRGVAPTTAEGVLDPSTMRKLFLYLRVCAVLRLREAVWLCSRKLPSLAGIALCVFV